jgi:AAA+ superfamily predicted ATPase
MINIHWILALLFISLKYTQGIAIGKTLASCKLIAARFKNTCSQSPDAAADWSPTSSLFTGANITCSNMLASACPDSTTETGLNTTSTCTWTR